jgi:hypothetical protein
MEVLRRPGLKGTSWAEAQVDTIRLRLLKIGTIVRLSVRRVLLQLSSAYRWKTSTSTPSKPRAVDKARSRENSTATAEEIIAERSHAQNTRTDMETKLK